MVGICATGSDLNGWNIVHKLLQIGLIDSLIQFEARIIAINVVKLEKIILWNKQCG